MESSTKPVMFIPLSKGKVTWIDFEDFDKPTRLGTVRDHSWFLIGDSYAAAKIDYCVVYLHNFIFEREPNLVSELHHKDENTLNNTRENLEELTRSEHKSRHKKNKFFGVCRDKHMQRWKAYLYHSGRNWHIGLYQKEEEAARAYDKAAKEYFGEKAKLNFPKISSTTDGIFHPEV